MTVLRQGVIDSLLAEHLYLIEPYEQPVSLFVAITTLSAGGMDIFSCVIENSKVDTYDIGTPTGKAR